MLVQHWVQNAYRRLCDRRPWSWLRAEGEIAIRDQKTAGTVTVTQDSASVVGAGTAWASTDVGRQFRIGLGPVYTVAAVASATALTLDRAYGGSSAAAQSYSILDAYFTAPADFGRWIAVLDTQNNWQLHIWVTEEEINTWDSQRSSSGTPWAVASRRLATVPTASAGRAEFEIWPYSTSEKVYPYYYIRRPENLSDTTNLLGLLGDRGDILIYGALAEAARWPGASVDQKNPFFNMTVARSYDDRFMEELNQLEVRDEEVYMTWYETVSWITRYPFAPLDSRYLQAHDVQTAQFGPYWTH